MTGIIHGVNTKKELKERVKSGYIGNIGIEDPSIVNSWFSSLRDWIESVKAGKLPNNFVITNHPKRSWFATLKINTDGKLIVS